MTTIPQNTNAYVPSPYCRRSSGSLSSISPPPFPTFQQNNSQYPVDHQQYPERYQPHPERQQQHPEQQPELQRQQQLLFRRESLYREASLDAEDEQRQQQQKISVPLHVGIGKEIGKNKDKLETKREHLVKLINSVGVRKKQFLKDIEVVRVGVQATADDIHKMVELNKNELLKKTDLIRESTLVELDKLKNELSVSLSSLQSFLADNQPEGHKTDKPDRALSGSFLRGPPPGPFDIGLTDTYDRRGMSGSFDRGLTDTYDSGGYDDDLYRPRKLLERLELKNEELKYLQENVIVCSVKFKKNESPSGNLIGQVSILDIDLSDPYATHPTLVNVIEGNEAVAGITVLDGEIYIVRDLLPNLDVYNCLDASPARRLKLDGLRRPSDIVGCSGWDGGVGEKGEKGEKGSNPLLFIADGSGYVYRLDPRGKALTRWIVEGEPHGLHLDTHGPDGIESGTGNLFVTCTDSRQIKEYTQEGTHLRNYRFQQDVANPWHALPVGDLYNRKIAVCHGLESGKFHRVVLVDSRGQTLKAFGSGAGSGSTKLDTPLRMCLDQFGYTFVADKNNDRVLLLSPNLVYVRDLVSGRMLLANNGSGVSGGSGGSGGWDSCSVVGAAVGRTFRQPKRMYLDGPEGLLYVSVIDGSVFVFRISD